MARRKTHIYSLGYMQWQFESFQRQSRKVLNSFPDAKMPADQFQAFHLVNLGQVAPDLFAGKSVEAERLRRHVTESMLQFPEFVGAALLFLRRKTPLSVSACVREFLLTEPQLHLTTGRFVDVADATDKEIAAAVAARYNLKVVSTKMVAHERKRLQKFGVSNAQHYTAILKLLPLSRSLD